MDHRQMGTEWAVSAERTRASLVSKSTEIRSIMISVRRSDRSQTKQQPKSPLNKSGLQPDDNGERRTDKGLLSLPVKIQILIPVMRFLLSVIKTESVGGGQGISHGLVLIDTATIGITTWQLPKRSETYLFFETARGEIDDCLLSRSSGVVSHAVSRVAQAYPQSGECSGISGELRSFLCELHHGDILPDCR